MRLLLGLALAAAVVTTAAAKLPPAPTEALIVPTGPAPCGLAAYRGELWVGVYEGGMLLRLDGAGRVQRRIGVGRWACRVAVDSDAVWVTRDRANEVVRIDRQTGRLPATVARFGIPGKGAIDVRIDGTGCLLRDGNALRASGAFTIVGGSGIYAGASGGGTISHDSWGPPGWNGTDTWTGTLVVPGLEFDVTPPTLSGARSKTVRAPKGRKRARVGYSVTATDDIDDGVPVSCEPRSGSYFPIGRTRVRCSAVDTSGNPIAAAFWITVKPAG
ncbi:MAG TPA: HYR domain-containing protein [Gaiellaceae bacterium]|jgi:hypothetical protein|nr:HYR domain-containing protein [Gaiellaceae bacterium]